MSRPALSGPARRLALLCALGGALALPAAASAEDYCVSVERCAAGTIAMSSLQDALTAARADAGESVVTVGPKADGTPHVGPFVYPGGGSLGNSVQIVGVNGPVLTTATAGSDVLAVNGPKGSTVRDITLKVPALPNVDGLVLDAGTASSVRVSGGGTAGVDRGVVLSDGAQLLSSTIDITGFGVEAAGGSVHVIRSDIRAGVGVVGADTDVRIDESTIDAGFQGIQLVRGGAGGFRDGLDVARSEVTTSAANGQGIFVRDADVNLTRTTVAGRSIAPDAGKAALKLETLERDADFSVRTSVLAGYDRGLDRKGQNGRTGPLSIFRSEWDAAHDVDGGQAAGPVSRTDFADAAPRFVDRVGADLRLRGGDGAIDAHAGPLEENDFVDIAGSDPVDGDGDGIVKIDAGAREYARTAPAIESLAAPSSGAAGAALAFAAKATDEDGEALTLAWDFGDGTTAAGPSVEHAFAAGGTHRVTLTVRDEGGATATRSVDVEVAGGPVPAVEPSGPGPIAPSGGGVVADRTAPSLRSAKLTVRRRALRGRKVRLAIDVSEAATLKLAVGRVKRTVAVRAGRSTETLVLTRRALRALARRRATLSIVALDAAGNRSAVKRISLTVKR